MNNIDLNEMSDTQVVTYALVMALTAPSEGQMQQCADIADSFAVGLSDAQLNACKAAARQIAEGSIGGMGD